MHPQQCRYRATRCSYAVCKLSPGNTGIGWVLNNTGKEEGKVCIHPHLSLGRRLLS
jgi:hypothetical protein